MVFLDVVLPWNCSVLSVKALEFEVRFGMNAFLWQTVNLKYICLFVVSYGFEPLCGERDWLNTFKNISVGCWKVERETDKKKTVYMRILRRRIFPPSQGEKKIILLIVLNKIPILGSIHTWQNCTWYLF